MLWTARRNDFRSQERFSSSRFKKRSPVEVDIAHVIHLGPPCALRSGCVEVVLELLGVADLTEP